VVKRLENRLSEKLGPVWLKVKVNLRCDLSYRISYRAIEIYKGLVTWYNTLQIMIYYNYASERAPRERSVTSFYEFTETGVRQDGKTEEDGVIHICDRIDNVEGR